MSIRLAGYIILCAIAFSLVRFALQKKHHIPIFRQLISRNQAYLILIVALTLLLALFIPNLKQQIEEMKKNL